MSLVLIVLLSIFGAILSLEIDPAGYMVYCPCMGRFGNQADHFLGVLAFAKNINRTLILPPWVEYQYGKPKADMVEFNRYFLVGPLLKYHRVIPMKKFMTDFAPTLWPPEKRAVLCWGPRQGSDGCSAKDGNPFGPFWDHSNIDFVKSEFYGDVGGYNLENEHVLDNWKKRFPASEYPVLAFTGAPAEFPVREQHRKLHKYLKWTSRVADEAKKFISERLPPGPFLGIHLRNDVDWNNVCEHVKDGSNTRQLFGSPQCLGYRNQHGTLSMQMCLPSQEIIEKQVAEAVQRIGAKSVFVAADRDHMIDRLNAYLQGVRVYRRDPDEPHVSLSILAKADHYIGNCVSTFSAFAKRERDVNGLPSSFWGFQPKIQNDEL